MDEVDLEWPTNEAHRDSGMNLLIVGKLFVDSVLVAFSGLAWPCCMAVGVVVGLVAVGLE